MTEHHHVITVLGKTALTGSVFVLLACVCFFGWMMCEGPYVDFDYERFWVVAGKVCLIAGTVILLGCGFAAIWGVR